MWFLFLLLSLYLSRDKLFFKLPIKSPLNAKVISPANTQFERDGRVLPKELLQLTFPLPKMAVHTLQTLVAQSTASLTALTGRNSMFTLVRRHLNT